MYLELHAYQHHVFMDWQFVDDEKWREVYVALNGAGVESMQAKWDEMFGEKKEERSETEEEAKVKKPRKKRVVKEKVESGMEKDVALAKPKRKRVAAKKKVEASQVDADTNAEKPSESE